VCAEPDILYWENTDDETITHKNLLPIKLPNFLRQKKLFWALPSNNRHSTELLAEVNSHVNRSWTQDKQHYTVDCKSSIFNYILKIWNSRAVLEEMDSR